MLCAWTKSSEMKSSFLPNVIFSTISCRFLPKPIPMLPFQFDVPVLLDLCGKSLVFFLSFLFSVVLLDVTGEDMPLNLRVPQLQGKWL